MAGPPAATGPNRGVSGWDATSAMAPPPAVSAVLVPGEKLLWAAPVSSRGSADALFRIGALWLLSVGVVASLAPWGQSMAAFCPPEEPPSCRKLYLSVFLLLFVGGPCSLSMLWMAWKARYRPWLWHCAVTTTRALLVDGRGPKLAGAVDLSRHPPLVDAKERLAFGKKPIRLAMWGALPPEERRRALYWADKAHEASRLDKTE